MRRFSLLVSVLFPILLPAAGPELGSRARGVNLVIAHRGSSADRPENTLAAYQRAVEAGAGAIEIDLRLTRDGQLVSLHDARVDRTTNGSGPVAAMSLSELLQLDAGSWFGESYRGIRVPTFRQIMRLARGQVDVLLDLKGSGTEYLRQIVAEVRSFAGPARILAGVHSLEQADYFRHNLPEARQIGLIPSPEEVEPFLKAGVGVIRLWPNWLDNRAAVQQIHAAHAGLLVNVDHGTREELDRVLPSGPTHLFTNDPARLVQTLRFLR